MAYFRQQRLNGNGVFANYVAVDAAPALQLSAEVGIFSTEFENANLVILTPPTSELTLDAAAGVFTTTYFQADLAGSLSLSAEPGLFIFTGNDANLSFSFDNLVWKFDDGAGTVAVCSQPGYNATVNADDWVTTPYNNKRWPINEGTGALLNEVLTGDADNPSLFTDITPTGSITTWDGTTLHMAGSASTATWVGTPVSGADYHVVFDYTVDADHVMYVRCGGGGNQAAITGPETGTFDAVLTAQGTDYLVLFQSSTGVGDYTNFSVKDAAGHTYDATIQNFIEGGWAD